MRQLLPYLAALGLSVALLAAGIVADGVWDWVSFLWMAWVVAAMDHFMQKPGRQPPEALAHWLPVAIGLVHFPLLIGAVVTLSQGGWWLNWLVFLFAASLFFGQIVNSTAHELIHQPSRFRRRLGRWIYITLLYGHQTTAHPLIHHVHVATPLDSNTARWDESWWRFMVRAWHQSFWNGLKLEKRRLQSKGLHGWNWRNPYWQYLLGAAACLGLAYGLLGPIGLGAYLLVCLFAQLQLLMTDYVLHYGMRRREIAPGKWEPVGARHSWNAPHVVSSLLTLQGPRHSDHHAHPRRGFQDLRLDDGVPMLPYALPVMVTLAFWPWYWRRMMNPRVAAVNDGAPPLAQPAPAAGAALPAGAVPAE